MVADEYPNNPFDGITKLQALISKSKTPENILWVFCALSPPHPINCVSVAHVFVVAC